MPDYAQIRYNRIRKILSLPEKPAWGEWVELTGISPAPCIGWYYDGSLFYDSTIPDSRRTKAVKLVKTITKSDLMNGVPSAVGKAVAALLLLSDLFEDE